jgi:Flp pilus assembly protein TadG
MSHLPIYQRNIRKAFQRRGLASVELAFVLPVLLVLVLGTVEVCQRIFLRQSAVIVAYEGARVAVRGTSSNADVVSRCQTMLLQRNVKGAVVTVTPADLLTQVTGTQIQVRVQVPWASNSPTRFVLQDQGTVSVDAFMLRE